MENGLNFGGYESDYASNKKSNFRKAGDAFTTEASIESSEEEPSEESSYSKWMSFMGNPSSNSNTTTNSNSSQTTSNTNTSAPQAIQPEAGIAESGIDFKAWAADTASGDKSGGQDADYWENTYRNNNAEIEKSRAMMANHQGPKSWDELSQIDQNRSGTGASKNQGTITDYGKLTKYLTAQQSVKQYEDAASKYQI
jgi:hypothetical protein